MNKHETGANSMKRKCAGVYSFKCEIVQRQLLFVNTMKWHAMTVIVIRTPGTY